MITACELGVGVGLVVGGGVGVGVVVGGGGGGGGGLVFPPCFARTALEKLKANSNISSCFNVFMMNYLFVMVVVLIDRLT
jgi:hypothetical protein